MGGCLSTSMNRIPATDSLFLICIPMKNKDMEMKDTKAVSMPHTGER